MTKLHTRALFISRRLEELFPETPIPLNHSSPYTLLVAVLLSAQCTDERVNQVTKKLFALASTPEQMILLTPDEIYEVIKPCGLGAMKSKALWNLSQIIIQKHGGCVPQSLKDLEELPGVGHKTASVVMVQCFHQPAFPVDTHIYRLARAWKISKGSNVKTVEEDLKKIYPENLWGKLHLQIIFFGRTYCKARQCDGKVCFLCHELKDLK
jgi:endonuclease-3